jgi:hypothetical protein
MLHNKLEGTAAVVCDMLQVDASQQVHAGGAAADEDPGCEIPGHQKQE